MPKRSPKKAGRQGSRAKRGPLHGLVVIDASRVLAGPFCGQLLSDLGATVIKIEQPGVGDETRTWGPPFAGELSAYFMACNRNKLSVTIDLAKPEGRKVLDRLLAKADVLLENFRSESLPKLGLAAKTLRKKFPKLVICSISGFGRDSSRATVPGYDFAIQALSGFMAITGAPDGEPSKAGVAVTDVFTGLYAATAVLGCLAGGRGRQQGAHIDMALLDCAIAAQVNLAQAYLTTGRVSQRMGNAHLQIVPYQLFKTKDAWLVLAVGNDRQWQKFIDVAGATAELGSANFAANRDRVERRGDVVPKVAKVVGRRTTQDWVDSLTAAGVPCAPVWTYADVFASELALERGWFEELTVAGGKKQKVLSHPFHIDTLGARASQPPPRLGEHTDQVLTKVAKLSPKQCRDLREKGVI